MEQLKLQAELPVRYMETTSTSRTTELKQAILGLQNEIATGKVQRKSDVQYYQRVISKPRAKQTIAEQFAYELKTMLQDKIVEMTKMLNIMTSLVDKIEGLHTK